MSRIDGFVCGSDIGLAGTFPCGCCCQDVPLEAMAQCGDGHLFCFQCLERRVQEATFGELPAYGPLECMDMNGCDKPIPWSEIERCIKPDLLFRFEKKQADESLVRAKLPGLITCPACSFACILDSDVLVFKCPNKRCEKATCTKCKEPSHQPLRCDEVEKAAETHIRNEVEEVMSQTLIRECAACKARVVKDGGCNKITCKCGQGMCYVCRQPIMDYSHFCEHFRDSNQPCKDCNKCNLWRKDDSTNVVQAAKKAAIACKARDFPHLRTRQIGPSDGLLSDKKRTKRSCMQRF